MKEWTLLLALALSLSALPTPAREVNNLDPISRELKVARDVFRSAMKNSLPDRIRVSNVRAQFLARQGVLVSMDIAVPWFDVDGFANRSVELSNDVESVHDLPELVNEILAELNVAMDQYPPEELTQLRALQAEQRGIRRTRSDLRGTLRSLRRALDGADDTDSLDLEIAEIESEIEALSDDHDQLDQEIDAENERISELSEESRLALSSVDIDEAVAETVCGYGATFKSLGSQQYLSIAVSRTDTVRYYVFLMEHVHDCRRGETTPARLLTRSYHYVL